MKTYLIPVLALAALVGTAQISGADDDAKNARLDKKAAKADGKFYVKRQQKALSILKSIKNDKGCKKALKQIHELYGKGGSGSTAMGSTQKPGNPGELKLDEQFQEKAEKINNDIATEEGRIRDAGVTCKELDDIMKAIKDARP